MNELVEREADRGPSGQLLDVVFDLPERSFAREAVGDGDPTARTPLDAEAEEVEAVVDMGDVRLLGRERQAHLLPHELGRLLFERLGLGLGATDQDHEVIRIADHSVAGLALGHPPLALVWRAGVPGVLEATVENREGNIREER